MGWSEMLARIGLGESTAKRFLRLRELEATVAEKVGFGREAGSISFSVAAELPRLRNGGERERVARACVENGLSKDEVRQIVQILSRSTRQADDVIDEVIEMRPQVHTIHAFLGAVEDSATQSWLASKNQAQRDELFADVLLESGADADVSGRLNPTSFSIVMQGEQSAASLGALEVRVNAHLDRRASA
jgi:hypothetical protein